MNTVTKKREVKATITDGDFIEVAVVTHTLVDGEVVGRSAPHRYSIAPGEKFSDKPRKVRRLCGLVHTPEAIARHNASQEYNNAVAAAVENPEGTNNKKKIKAAKKALKDAQELYDQSL